MPLVQVSVVKGVFSSQQKAEMISLLTDAMVRVEGENMRAATWVKIEEIESGSFGVGGRAMTTEDVRAIAAGKKPVGAG